MFHSHTFRVALLLLAGVCSAVQSAEPSLAKRVDKAIQATPGHEKQVAPLANDAEFLRRVSLDLTGIIPTSAKTKAFLADKSADKRVKLVEELLQSPGYARHMQEVFDALLMERRADKHVPRAQWQEYLRTSFANNKPWDELTRELLAADGADAKTRAAAKFYLDREGEPHQVTRDIGRLFLGINLQCAQCHDHPNVKTYKQDHYYGIYAFVSRGFLFADAKAKQSVYAEKGEGEVTYQSVFDPTKATKASGPRLPFGSVIMEPKVEKGKEYTVAPAKDVRPVPKHSRRALLPEQLLKPESEAFRKNITNRLWAQVMGRGLVHPVDFQHDANPPSHPELLSELSAAFQEQKYDVRSFLKELVLSETYQRSSEIPKGVNEPTPTLFAVGALKPLSPEQLAWSLMQATGVLDVERVAQAKSPNEAALYAKFAGQVGTFVSTFGARAGEPEAFQATLDQALFLNHGDLLNSWLAPKPGNLIARLQALTEAKEIADELYVSVLCRLPDESERKEVAEYLAKRGEKKLPALQELSWVLLTSAEFRFNH